MYVHTCAHTVHAHVHVYMCLVRACLAFNGAEGDQNTGNSQRESVWIRSGCTRTQAAPRTTLRLQRESGSPPGDQGLGGGRGGRGGLLGCVPDPPPIPAPYHCNIGFNMLFSILLLIPNTGCSCLCTLYMHIHTLESICAGT